MVCLILSSVQAPRLWQASQHGALSFSIDIVALNGAHRQDWAALRDALQK